VKDSKLQALGAMSDQTAKLISVGSWKQEVEHISWACFQSIVVSTRRSYWSALNTFINSVGWSAAGDANTIVGYCRRMVNLGKWASHAAPTYLTRLLSAMKWLGFSIPSFNMLGVPTRRVKAALRRLATSQGTQHRQACSWKQLKKTSAILKQGWNTLGLSEPTVQERAAATAALFIGFQGMMRSSELKHLLWSDISIPVSNPARPSYAAFVLTIRDKTHAEPNRVVHTRVTRHWSKAAEYVGSKILEGQSRGGNKSAARLLSPYAWLAIKTTLRLVGLTPGCLRPGGHMFWLEKGLATQVIHKLGGWAPSSGIPSRHYTSISSNILLEKDRVLAVKQCHRLPTAKQVAGWVKRWRQESR